MGNIHETMHLYGRVNQVRFVDAETGADVDRVVFPMERVSTDLSETMAIIEVSDGTAVVTGMEPAGDPAFKAMPNAMIESALREAFRAIAALGMGGGSFPDGEGRRISAEHLILYPATMHEMHAPRDGAAGNASVRSQHATLVGGACAVVVAAMVLVALGYADPFVLLLVPGVAMWAWGLMRGMRNRALVISAAPSYNEHVRRANAQSRSISTAANRARGLTS